MSEPDALQKIEYRSEKNSEKKKFPRRRQSVEQRSVFFLTFSDILVFPGVPFVRPSETWLYYVLVRTNIVPITLLCRVMEFNNKLQYELCVYEQNKLKKHIERLYEESFRL